MDYDSDSSIEDVDRANWGNPRRRQRQQQQNRWQQQQQQQQQWAQPKQQQWHHLTPLFFRNLFIITIILATYYVSNYWTSPYLSKPRTAASLSQQAKHHSLTAPLRLNLTAEMAPLFHGYRDVLTNPDFDGWFADVDAATAAIDTMLAAVPAGHPHRAELEEGVGKRRRHLALARGLYDQFLDSRAATARSVLEIASLWRQYVERKLLLPAPPDRDTSNSSNSSSSSRNGSEAEAFFEKSVGISTFAPGDFSNRTSAALTISARTLAGELSRAHFRLWVPAVFGFAPAARASERAFLAGLLDASPAAAVWTKGVAGALGRLAERAERAGRWHDGALEALRWLETRLGYDLEASYATGRDALVWAQGAEEMAEGWGALVSEVEEGLLVALQRQIQRRLEKKTGGSGFEGLREGLWELWKGLNCGGTSCYDDKSADSWAKWLFGGVGAKPRAYVARDEERWSNGLKDGKSFRISRGVYDQACCHDGGLARLLKYGA